MPSRRYFIRIAVAVFIVVGAMMGALGALRMETRVLSTGRYDTRPHSFIIRKHNADTTAARMYENLATEGEIITGDTPNARSTILQHEVSQTAPTTSPDAAALFTALVTGRRNYIPLVVQDLVRRSGISHLLALSGFHLQALLLLISIVRRRVPRVFFYGMSCALVWVYCLWIGFIPSLWRAGMMYTISAAGILLIGAARFSVVWAMTGLVMLVFAPRAVVMPGFILSMLALCGVVHGGRVYDTVFRWYGTLCMALMRHVAGRFAVCSSECTPRNAVTKMVVKITKFVVSAFAVGVGATVSTAWYGMLIFGAVYPIGIFASVLLTPAVVVFIMAGIAFLALSFLANATHAIIIASAPSDALFYNLFGWMCNMGHHTTVWVANVISGGMEYFTRAIIFVLVRTAGVGDIHSWVGMVAFYALCAGVCIPYVIQIKNIKTKSNVHQTTNTTILPRAEHKA